MGGLPNLNHCCVCMKDRVEGVGIRILQSGVLPGATQNMGLIIMISEVYGVPKIGGVPFWGAYRLVVGFWALY